MNSLKKKIRTNADKKVQRRQKSTGLNAWKLPFYGQADQNGIKQYQQEVAPK